MRDELNFKKPFYGACISVRSTLSQTLRPSEFKGRSFVVFISGGSGLAVYIAASVLGPWALQPHSDINCAADVPLCGSFGARQVDRQDLVFNAQWWSVSKIPTAGGGEAFILSGRRWLSGAGNNAACDDMCDNDGRPFAPCVNAGYKLRDDCDVWYPLEFDAGGDVLPLRPLDSFTLDLP